MSSKRQATYDLNRDNCDDELPHEEAGHWKTASEDDLKARPKLKARRTIVNTSGSEPGSASLFGGWSFNPAKTSTAPSFSFSSLTNPSSTANNSKSEDSNGQESKTSSNPSIISKSEQRKKEISEKKLSLLKEKKRIEEELWSLELEEKQIERDEIELTKDSQTSQASGTSVASFGSMVVEPPTPTEDQEIELPPEEPWN